MNVSVRWLDMTQSLASGQQPNVLVERPQAGVDGARPPNGGGIYGSAKLARVGEFWIPTSPINSEDIAWEVSKQGNHMRIPVHAYRTPQLSKAVIAACGFELGLRAGFAVAKQIGNMVPTEVTLIMGNRCDRVDDVYRYYLGLAIQVEGK